MVNRKDSWGETAKWLALLLLLLVAVLTVLSLVATVAEAQESDPIIPSIDGSEDPLTLLIKLLFILVQVSLIPAAVQYFRAKGHAIEAKHQASFHAAAATAAALVMDMRSKVDYVRVSVPDATKYLNVADSVIQAVITSYENGRGTTAPAPSLTPPAESVTLR